MANLTHVFPNSTPRKPGWTHRALPRPCPDLPQPCPDRAGTCPRLLQPCPDRAGACPPLEVSPHSRLHENFQVPRTGMLFRGQPHACFLKFHLTKIRWTCKTFQGLCPSLARTCADPARTVPGLCPHLLRPLPRQCRDLPRTSLGPHPGAFPRLGIISGSLTPDLPRTRPARRLWSELFPRLSIISESSSQKV